MVRLTTKLALCAVALCAGCTENAVIQREARSIEGGASHLSAPRGRLVESPRKVTTLRVRPAPAVAIVDTTARLQLGTLPALDADLLFELRWARHMERSELSEKTKNRFIPPAAKAWGAYYGTYDKAYDAALALRP